MIGPSGTPVGTPVLTMYRMVQFPMILNSP